MTETLPALCGWALASLGRPCVAQRVCPMPSVPSGVSPRHHRLEPRQLAPAAQHLGAPRADDRHSGRVVAPVLETPQSAKQDRNRLLLPYVSNDSTHELNVRLTDRLGDWEPGWPDPFAGVWDPLGVPPVVIACGDLRA